MKILVTGAAGFIGHHVVIALLSKGHSVVGIDSINNYYDPLLKYARMNLSGITINETDYGKPTQSFLYKNYYFIHTDITDRQRISNLFIEESFDIVCHLAAQAGVRYSIENPHAYVDSNLTGFLNILEECCRDAKTNKCLNKNETSKENNIQRTIPMVYASSSSVYGQNKNVPFTESDVVDGPVSLYAVTKRTNELMAYSYCTLYGLPSVGLRFFTVYGPWGRPDMAPTLFANAITSGELIKVFNNGQMQRDFTYIDDIVEGVVRVVEGIKDGAGSAVFKKLTTKQDELTNNNSSINNLPYRIYNIGYGNPIDLMEFINEMEQAIGSPTKKQLLPMQLGDVPVTWSNTSALKDDFGYKPLINIHEGIAKFIKWYKAYYKR